MLESKGQAFSLVGSDGDGGAQDCELDSAHALHEASHVEAIHERIVGSD